MGIFLVLIPIPTVSSHDDPGSFYLLKSQTTKFHDREKQVLNFPTYVKLTIVEKT